MHRTLFRMIGIFLVLGNICYAQMIVKDSDANVLMQVNDEGSVGSITLPAGSSPSSTTAKLYNQGGDLYWNGSALGTAGSAGGWTDDGTVVRLTTGTDKVGIGTDTPEFKLSLDDDGGILAEGTVDSGATLYASGAGARLIWYPKKAAFRVGYVASSQWDNASLGNYSFAAGYNTTASGEHSTALGLNTTASGTYSTALGDSTTASGTYSTALGYNTTASGNNSTALGYNTTASGKRSMAMGVWTLADAYCSVAMGHWNVGGGTADTWVDTEPLFEIGNGDGLGGASSRANALTVLKNGNTGIGTATPQATLHVNSVMRLEPQSSAPTGGQGDLYSGTDGKLYFHNGTSWKEVQLTP